MKSKNILHPDRLFPNDRAIRDIARELYAQIRELPIVSPHGHTDPSSFALNKPFPNAVDLLLVPDHYLLRMLYSHGVPMESLGVSTIDATEVETDKRKIWQTFADHYYLFRGTPSRIWLDYVFCDVFKLEVSLTSDNANEIFDVINKALNGDDFRPRALFDRFNIELLATTDSPLDTLEYHQAIRHSDWDRRVIPSYRPDPVVSPDLDTFAENVALFGKLTGEDTLTWSGYLAAHRRRREFFKSMGATSTDHGHPTAATANLSKRECAALFAKALQGQCSPAEAELFRGQMLTEMAAMSLEDGLVMQIHAGSVRNHNPSVLKRFGRDKGADIPSPIEYVNALKPLLDRFGNEKDLTVILFTLDESNYSRELAPLAGHYPCLFLGPPWWFHDSPEGMRRFREQTTETAGFYKTVGFNDDTRAFLSIPARHDLARRMDCAFLAELVADHRLRQDEAAEVAVDLAYNLVRKAYRLE